MAGVTYPWAASDSVTGAAESSFQEGQQVLRQQLFRQAAGDNDTSETLRKNYAAFNMMSMAVISQQMNGQAPLLATDTLAYNATAGQPYKSPDPTVTLVQPPPKTS